MAAPHEQPTNLAEERRREAFDHAASAFQRTIDALSRLTRAEDFIPAVLHIVSDAFGARSCSFFEHRGDTSWLRYWWHEGRVLGPTDLRRVDPEQHTAIVRMARGITVSRAHLDVDPFARVQPSLVEHRRLEGDRELQRFAVSMGWDRELNVPLVVGGQAAGALVIYRAEDAPFDARDVALGTALGKQLALALQLEKLLDQERERVAGRDPHVATEHRLAGLLKINEALAKSVDSLAEAPDIEELLGEVLRIAAEQAGVELAHLWVHDDEGWVTLRRGYCQGVVFGREDSAAMPLAPTYATPFQVPSAMIHGESIFDRTRDLVQDVLVDEYARQIGGDTIDVYRELGVQWELNVPLRFGGRCVAHLAVYLPAGREVSPDLVEMVHALGRQVTLAMELARISADARNVAVSREREVAALERARLMDRAVAAMRRSSDSLLGANEPRDAIVATLRAMEDVLSSLGVIETGLIEISRTARTARCTVMISGGKLQELAGSALARDWPLDEPPIQVPWKRISSGAPFVWGLTSDPSTLVPDVRAIHEAMGARAVGYVPLVRGDDTIGWIAMSFRELAPPSEHHISLVRALAVQVFLAIELERIAVKSREVALAKERETAALAQAAQQARATEALSQTVAALRSAEDFEDFVPAVLGIVARAFGAASSAVYETRGDIVYLRHWYLDGVVYGPRDMLALDPVKWGTIRVLASGFTVPLEYLEGEAVNGRTKAVVVNHRSGTARADFDAFARDTGWDLELNAPILIEGKPVGALCIYRGSDASYSAAEVALAETLTAQLALAMEAHRVSNHARERAVKIARLEQETESLERVAMAMRLCADSLGDARDSRNVMVEALRAANHVLAPLGVLSAGIDERQPGSDSLRLVVYMRRGQDVPLPLEGDELTNRHRFGVQGNVPRNEWPLDSPLMATIWRRIEREAFVWGLTSDTTVVHPDARAWHESEGAQAVAYVPLRRGAETFAFVGFLLETSVAPSPSQIWLTQVLCTQVFLAMEMHRVAAEAQRAAIQIARLEEAEASAARQLAREETASAALQQMIDAVSALPTLDELIPVALGVVSHTFGVGDCSYYDVPPDQPIRLRFWAHDGQVLTPAALASIMPQRPELIELLRTGFEVPDSYFGEHNRDRTRACTLDHARGTSVPEFDAWAIENGIPSELNMPLVANGRMVGALVINRPAGGTFSVDDVNLAERLGKQLALAVATARLAEEARETAVARAAEAAAVRHADELERANSALRRAVEGLAGLEDVRAFLDALLQTGIDVAGAHGGAIASLTPEGIETLVVRDQRGPVSRERSIADGTAIMPMTLIVEAMCRRSISGESVSWEVPVDGPPNPSSMLAYHRRNGTRAVRWVPMLVGSRLIGWLALWFPAAETDSTQQSLLLRLLADQATTAMEMARLADIAKRAAITEERTRMAGEIHDSLAQSFSSIALQSEALISKLEESSPFRKTVAIIDATARLGLAEARTSVLALRPVGDAIGELQRALAQLAERSNVAGSVSCEFRASTAPCALRADVRDGFFRVAQEAVSNALRHAKARRVVIEFDVRADLASLTVTDDGIGVPDRASQSGGWGIDGMCARAESLGGTLTISPGEGGGTVVNMRLPCNPRETKRS